MNFRVEQKEDDLWMVQPASNSAILATGRTAYDALQRFQKDVLEFVDMETRHMLRRQADARKMPS